MQEEFYFVDIPNYPNYKINKLGTIINKKSGREIKGRDSNGYRRLCLINEYGSGDIFVHKILAELFIQNPKNKLFVDHVDRNRSNNNLSNLRWVSRSENGTNRKIQSNNTSGYTGINKKKLARTSGEEEDIYWCANITKNNTSIYKCFPYNDEGKLQAIKWREDMKEKLHTYD